jgi:hypothetical protein
VLNQGVSGSIREYQESRSGMGVSGVPDNVQLDVMRMPEPKEFRRLRQHRHSFSGSQAPLGTQGTSGISGISGISGSGMGVSGSLPDLPDSTQPVSFVTSPVETDGESPAQTMGCLAWYGAIRHLGLCEVRRIA